MTDEPDLNELKRYFKAVAAASARKKSANRKFIEASEKLDESEASLAHANEELDKALSNQLKIYSRLVNGA
jgi:hypothetical protein